MTKGRAATHRLPLLLLFCLLFYFLQGDVESIAQKSAKDMTEHVSRVKGVTDVIVRLLAPHVC